MLSDKVDKFVLDKHKDSFQFKSFKKELENAYKWCFKKYDKNELLNFNKAKDSDKQKSIQSKIRIYKRLLTKAKGEKKKTIESKLRIYNRLLKA